MTTKNTDFGALAASMRGSVTTPESDDYDEARSVYNGDDRPATGGDRRLRRHR